MFPLLLVQLLAFVDALLNCEDSGVKRVLILTPVNTLYNWRNELERWIPTYDYGVSVEHTHTHTHTHACMDAHALTHIHTRMHALHTHTHTHTQVYLMNVPGIANRVKKLKRWHHYGGIMFIGYDMFRNLASGKAKNCRQKAKDDLAKCLLDPGKLKIGPEIKST